MTKKNQHKTVIRMFGKQQFSFGFFKRICTYAIMCGLLFPAQLYAVPLTSVADIQTNSSTLGDTFILGSGTGTYDIFSTVNPVINVNANPIVNSMRINGNTTLNIGTAGSHTNFLLYAKDFTVAGGQLTAKGGVGNNSYGLQLSNNFMQSGGTVNITGGTAVSAHGLTIINQFVQSGGTLTTAGGTNPALGITDVHGVVVGSFIQNNGTINATGGAGERTYGMYLVDVASGSFIQNNGSIVARGGSGENSTGIKVTVDFTQAGAGVIQAFGGTAVTAVGISANGNFYQTGAGRIEATGGSANRARGIALTGDFYQNNAAATIIATGGSVFQAHGIWARQFIQTAGSVTATAGSVAYGIFLTGAGSTYTQAGGSLVATGLTGGDATGVHISENFEQTGAGSVSAQAGSGLSAHGIHVRQNFTQSGAGTITATGGAGATAHGINVLQNFIQSGTGTVTATGSATGAGNGLRVAFDIAQSAGIMRLTGGSAGSAYGAYTAQDFNQSGTGVVIAQAGNAPSADGLYVVGGFNQSGTGTITATGGSDANTYGIHVRQNFTQGGAGTVNAQAGSGSHADGLYVVGGFNQSGAGTITAISGLGVNAHGINIGTDFTQSNTGTVNAQAGSGVTAHGINIGQNFTQSGAGTITATGGSGSNAYGINIGTDFTQSNTGTVNAQAGSGVTAHGINVGQNLIQNNSGSITATGSSTSAGDGIWVGLDATQSAGTMNVTGGAAANAYGLYTFQDFNQSGTGIITAQAGAGANAHGLRVNRDFSQTGGSVAATASNALNGYGAYVHETANIDGTLTLTPNMGGAVNNPAFYVNNTSTAATGLTFGANSQLTLNLDGNTQRSGLLQVNTGDTNITSGAGVNVGFVHNMHSLPIGQPITMLFLENVDPAATIADQFQFLDTHPTLDWSIAQIGNDYYLTVTRTGETIIVVPPSGNSDVDFLVNTENLINSFPNLAGVNTPESQLLRHYADIFENSLTAEEAKSNARFLQHNLTPNAFTRVPRLAVQDTVFIRNSMHKNLTVIKPYATVASSEAELLTSNLVVNVADSTNIPNDVFLFYKERDDLGWQMWMDSYGQVGRIKSRTEEYNDATQQTVGMAIGARHLFESGNSLAIAGHYLNGTVKTGTGQWGGKTDIRTQSSGASIGLRLLLPEIEVADFNVMPRLELMATYSALNIDQQRHVFNNRLDSDTNGDLYQGHVMLYTPFTVGDKTLITPELGMTYSSVNIDKFKEQNHNNLGLTTDPQDYNSLLVHLGIKAETAATASTSLYGGISISKDLLEEQVKLDNSFRSVSQVRFQTVGEEDTGVTAHLRTGINVRVWEDAYLNAEYTFGASQGNQNHSIGFNFSIGF